MICSLALSGPLYMTVLYSYVSKVQTYVAVDSELLHLDDDYSCESQHLDGNSRLVWTLCRYIQCDQEEWILSHRHRKALL